MFIFPILLFIMWICYGFTYYKKSEHDNNITKKIVHCFICIVMSPVILIRETIDELINYKRII